MSTNEEEKREWARKYALRIEHRFEQWQKPIGIDGTEYLQYLTEKFVDFCDNPLRKSLIESIS